MSDSAVHDLSNDRFADGRNVISSSNMDTIMSLPNVCNFSNLESVFYGKTVLRTVTKENNFTDKVNQH